MLFLTSFWGMSWLGKNPKKKKTIKLYSELQSFFNTFFFPSLWQSIMFISTTGKSHSIIFPQNGMLGKLTEGYQLQFISLTAIITGPLRQDCIILPDVDLRNKLSVLFVWLAIPGYTRECIILGSSELTAPYWLQFLPATTLGSRAVTLWPRGDSKSHAEK